MFKTITSLVLLFTTSMFVAQSQEITDKELQQFADAFQQVRVLNQSSQQKMLTAVEEEDISVERFNTINQAEQNPNKEADATDAELEKYKSAMKSVEVIQAEIQKKLQEKIEESGMSLERYQQIATQLQTDQNLQQRLTELMQK